MSFMRILHTILALSLVALATNVHAGPVDLTAWPDHGSISGQAGELVSYPSHSPFTLWEVGKSEMLDPPTDANAFLFMPEAASADAPVPAVVLLHGAAGVLSARELTYGAQFAQMGVAALVVDAFGARRDRAVPAQGDPGRVLRQRRIPDRPRRRRPQPVEPRRRRVPDARLQRRRLGPSATQSFNGSAQPGGTGTRNVLRIAAT